MCALSALSRSFSSWRMVGNVRIVISPRCALRISMNRLMCVPLNSWGRLTDIESRGVVDWSADMDFNPEAMAVETTAFVSCRDVGQAMRSLDREFLENFHGHLLRNPQLFVRLQAQLPLRIRQAVPECKLRVRLACW